MNNQTTQRPTPETDYHAKLYGSGDAVMADFARKLERERDEAREYAERCKQICISLSSAVDRIDYACGEPNEMEVSDYCVHRNEEHVVQRVKEKFEAMREAIKEAAKSIGDLRELFDRCSIEEVPTDFDGTLQESKAALAKLQPFITP